MGYITELRSRGLLKNLSDPYNSNSLYRVLLVTLDAGERFYKEKRKEKSASNNAWEAKKGTEKTEFNTT